MCHVTTLPSPGHSLSAPPTLTVAIMSTDKPPAAQIQHDEKKTATFDATPSTTPGDSASDKIAKAVLETDQQKVKDCTDDIDTLLLVVCHLSILRHLLSSQTLRQGWLIRRCINAIVGRIVPDSSPRSRRHDDITTAADRATNGLIYVVHD